jgi:hypothetical protein
LAAVGSGSAFRPIQAWIPRHKTRTRRATINRSLMQPWQVVLITRGRSPCLATMKRSWRAWFCRFPASAQGWPLSYSVRAEHLPIQTTRW